MAQRNLWIPAGIATIVVIIPGSIYLWGLSLPSTYTSTASTLVPGTPTEVWDTMVDWEHQHEWRRDIVRFELVSDGEPVVFQQEYKGGNVLEFTQSDAVPAQHLVWTGKGVDNPDLGAIWTVDLAPEGGSTRVTVTEQGAISGPVARVIHFNLVGKSLMPRLYLIDLAERRGGQAVFRDAEPQGKGDAT